jgi:integrase
MRKRNLKQFTDESVLSLPVKRRQHMAWDTGAAAARGLGILISPSGAKSYRVTYYFPGSAKGYSMHIGRVGEMSLEDARTRARLAREKARQGIDPKGDDLSKSTDLKSAIEQYVKQELIGRRGNVTAPETQRVLVRACAQWMHRPIATIRVQEIDKLVSAIRDGDDGAPSRGPYIANKVYGSLANFFAWCAKPNIAKLRSSPMVGMDKPFTKERPRSRVFSNDELKLIWVAADKLPHVEGRYLKMLVCTGKRKGALSEMKWEEIDQDWFWNPPPSEHRNKRLHPIPLPKLAQRILGPRQAKGFVFPGPLKHTHYSDAENALHQKVKRRVDLKDFYVHALRHTVETQMAALGVPPHIRDLLFDHRPTRGAGAGYDHYSYGKEMRAAMDLWAAHIEQLVQPKGARVLR